MSHPLARKDDLVVRRLAGETIISDTKNDKVHCLNPVSTWIWDHCDGQTSVADLATKLHEELQQPRSEELVQLALTQLDRRGLLAQAVPAVANTPARKLSRREALRSLAAAAVALPLVMTLSAQTARANGFSVLLGCLYYSATLNTTFPANEGGPCITFDGFVGTCFGGVCVPPIIIAVPEIIIGP